MKSRVTTFMQIEAYASIATPTLNFCRTLENHLQKKQQLEEESNRFFNSITDQCSCDFMYTGFPVLPGIYRGKVAANPTLSIQSASVRFGCTYVVASDICLTRCYHRWCYVLIHIP